MAGKIPLNSEGFERRKTAQQSVPHEHRDKSHPTPGRASGLSWWDTTQSAFLSSLRGLRLVPANWRYLVPPTSPHQGATQYP